MAKFPKRFEKFKNDYPKIAEAYERLANEVHSAVPIEYKTDSLVKLARSVVARSEVAVHSHT